MFSSTAQPVRETSPFWTSVREALAGVPRDYTQGSISRAITLLAIPMVLEMVMESLFSVVDMFFIAHLGADAVATVGLTESLLTPLFAVALGLSMGTTAIVSRRIGEKDAHGASVAAAQAILVGIGVSAVAGTLGYTFAADLLRLMGAHEGVLQHASYTRTILGGSATIFFLFLINAAFRGAGDPALAMRTLWLANLINIILNPVLILGLGPFPALGVNGSAIGTTIGRGIGVMYQLAILSGGKARIAVPLSALRPQWTVMAKLVRVSLGGMLQYTINVASWIALVRMAASFGSAAIAGYTVGVRIIVFGILPSWGLSNAAATLVGQNLGAGQPDRAERSVWLTGLYNMVFLGGLGAIFIAFAHSIVSVFTTDAAVIQVAAASLRYISYGYLFYAFGMVIVQSFNGAGDTYTPTIINLFCYWMWQIPLAWWLAFEAGLGVRGIFVAIAVSESTLAVVAVLAFRRGSWKKKRV
jgi:putative MATE family efflux protein